MKGQESTIYKHLLRGMLAMSVGAVALLMTGVAPAIFSQKGNFSIQAAGQEPKKAATVQREPAEPMYSVVSPLGDSTVKMITMVPRLNSLAGKTVCTVWNNAFKADVTLPAIAEALKSKYPDIKIVPYTEIRTGRSDSSQADARSLQEAFKAKGCNAVISGNGG